LLFRGPLPGAADLKVISAGAVRGLIRADHRRLCASDRAEIRPSRSARPGNCATSSSHRASPPADLLIVSTPPDGRNSRRPASSLAKQAAPISAVVGIGRRQSGTGAAAPDVATPDAFKQALVGRPFGRLHRPGAGRHVRYLFCRPGGAPRRRRTPVKRKVGGSPAAGREAAIEVAEGPRRGWRSCSSARPWRSRVLRLAGPAAGAAAGLLGLRGRDPGPAVPTSPRARAFVGRPQRRPRWRSAGRANGFEPPK